MVVDIVVLLPDSAVFLVRRGSEECVVPSWWCVTIYLQANSSKRTIVPEQIGMVKEETSFLFTTRGERPLDLDYAQNLWDGCFRGGDGEGCSPVDPS
jgi:hypothetical protein